MIKLDVIGSTEYFNKLRNSKINKFRSVTINFGSLGYPSIKSKYVLIGDDEIKIKTDVSIRELNKLVKKEYNTINKLNDFYLVLSL